jgi:hypothetical protein
MNKILNSLLELIRTVRESAIRNNAIVWLEDDPLNRRIGFFVSDGCIEERYYIDISKLRGDPTLSRFKNYIITTDNRKNLAALLSSKECLVICSKHDEYDSACDECVNVMIAGVMLS